jgi:hypothetical protein
MRVADLGAVESEHDRERFRVELWPRRTNSPMAVLGTAGGR